MPSPELQPFIARLRRLEGQVQQLERAGLQGGALEGLLNGGANGEALRNRTTTVGEKRWLWGTHATIAPFTYGFSQYGSDDYYGS